MLDFQLELYGYMIAIGFLTAELTVFPKLTGKAFPWRESLQSLTLVFLVTLANVVFAFVPTGAFALAHQHRFFDVPYASHWSMFFVYLFAGELSFYWYHRLSHKIRFLWCNHSVHHAPKRIYVLMTAQRSIFDVFLGHWIGYLPLVLLGFDPLILGRFIVLTMVYSYLVHNEDVPKLGPLEWIVTTPSIHRVHHALNDEYVDKNFGGIFAIYDRLFGTFAKEEDDKRCVYGLRDGFDSLAPGEVLFHEWKKLWNDLRSAPSWRSRILLLVSFSENGSKEASVKEAA